MRTDGNQPVRLAKHRELLVWTVILISFSGLIFASSHCFARQQRTIWLDDGECELLGVHENGILMIRLIDSGNTVLFKFAGIQLRDTGDRGTGGLENYLRAWSQQSKTFVRFDRQRFDTANFALGYLFVDGEIINIQLVEDGWAEPAPIQGNSTSIQRKIRDAENTRLQSADNNWAGSR